MRFALAAVALAVLCGCSSQSGGAGRTEDGSSRCTAIRHAIERDKVAVQEATDSAGAARARGEVEADARAARSLASCDISDLVGANVGQ